jgi:hypothetical protein
LYPVPRRLRGFPVLPRAIRARGEKVNGADVETQIAVLWHAEKDKVKYLVLAADDSLLPSGA